MLPADRDELNEFMQKSVSNTKMVVEIVLPNVCAFLPSKHFFEVLYNRYLFYKYTSSCQSTAAFLC